MLKPTQVGVVEDIVVDNNFLLRNYETALIIIPH